jgi:hypothetical protein
MQFRRLPRSSSIKCALAEWHEQLPPRLERYAGSGRRPLVLVKKPVQCRELLLATLPSPLQSRKEQRWSRKAGERTAA